VTMLYAGSDVDAGATIFEWLRPRAPLVPTTVCSFRLDDVAKRLPNQIALIEIDVEGAELEVLRGAEHTINSTRPWIICEVLHRDLFADAKSYHERLALLARFIAQIQYEVLRIVRTSDAARVSRLERVSGFPEKVWHAGSEAECDYLLVPYGQGAEAQNMF
jgi:hypothetical protein